VPADSVLGLFFAYRVLDHFLLAEKISQAKTASVVVEVHELSVPIYCFVNNNYNRLVSVAPGRRCNGLPRSILNKGERSPTRNKTLLSAGLRRACVFVSLWVHLLWHCLTSAA